MHKYDLMSNCKYNKIMKKSVRFSNPLIIPSKILSIYQKRSECISIIKSKCTNDLQIINKIMNICNKYIADDNYVYACFDKYMLVLLKTTITKTNENRKQITNKLHALYRGNTFIVELIIDKSTGDLHERLKYDKFKYIIVGHEIKSVYNTDIDVIYENGILYYLTPKLAYYHKFHLIKNITSSYLEYYDDGVIKCEGYYKNGKKHNVWKLYNTIGKLKCVTIYDLDDIKRMICY